MSNSYAPGDLVQFRHGRQVLHGTIKEISAGFGKREVTIELTWTDLGGIVHYTDVTVPYGALAGRCRVSGERL